MRTIVVYLGLHIAIAYGLNYPSGITSSLRSIIEKSGLDTNYFAAIDHTEQLFENIGGKISNGISQVNDINKGLYDFEANVLLLLIQSKENFVKYVTNVEIQNFLSLLIPEATIALAFLAAFGVLLLVDEEDIDCPYEEGKYDLFRAQEFYNKRPLVILKRLLKVSTITSSFNIKLLLDWRLGNIERNQKLRAKEALKIVSQLGPTFIKLGQALSIRTDLIPEDYALELRTLQDAVPPFPDQIARDILCEQLNINDLSTVFAELSERPIASASIGQVYKGKLKDGRVVAVKVQRPKVLNEIALDLYLLRLLAPFQVRIANLVNKRKTTDADIDVALTLIEEWGRGFVAEVDYALEANNQKTFIEAMRSRNLNAIVAPNVIEPLCRSKVLVTEWVDGTRLDKDASPDVPRLCGVAVNAYLTMLLDTGTLHCEKELNQLVGLLPSTTKSMSTNLLYRMPATKKPISVPSSDLPSCPCLMSCHSPHPGNLLRTLDGKLCVLDWGMTLEVPRDLQYGLIDFIAHVNAEDFEKLPEDFVKIGFTPADKLEQVKRSGIVEGLSFGLRQLGKGGGPAKMRSRIIEEFRDRYGRDISDEELRRRVRQDMVNQMDARLKEEGMDVKDMAGVMEEMSKRNREMFRLPSYVLYVIRAFSTLEGIGLTVDENFSILKESYPYLARRLFTDPSPRAQSALRAMLFESGGSSGGLLSPNKLLELSDGFTSYTAATSAADRDTEGNRLAKEQLQSIVLSPNGSFVQDLLLETSARVTDSMLRLAYSRVSESGAGSALKRIAAMPRDVAHRLLPPRLRGIALPLTLPYEILQATDHLLQMDEGDRATVQGVQSLVALLQSQVGQGTENGQSSSVGVGERVADANGDADGLTSGETLATLRSQLRSLPSNPTAIVNQLPLVASLSRKLTVALLRRSAERFEQSRPPLNNLYNETQSNEVLLRDLVTTSVSTVASGGARTLASLLSNDVVV